MQITADKRVLISPDVQPQTSLYYISLLHIQPLKVTLSFEASPAIRNNFTDLVFNPLQLVLSMASGVLGNISEAPIELNSLMIENAFGDVSSLLAPVMHFYISQGIRQGYKIIGSVEALGNPVNLVSGLGSGVKDFFYEPAQGLVSSPKEFGTGLYKGSASLVKNVGAGVFGAASKITSSVGRGVALMTMDERFVRRRNIALNQRVTHVGHGLLRGAQAFGTGLISGLAGIIMDPVRGARREGLKGFFKGVGKGVVGVFTKTAVGTLDLVSITFRGIQATFALIGGSRGLSGRRRFPRYIGPTGALKPYDPRSAFGQYLLYQIAHRTDYGMGAFLRETFEIGSDRNDELDEALAAADLAELFNADDALLETLALAESEYDISGSYAEDDASMAGSGVSSSTSTSTSPLTSPSSRSRLRDYNMNRNVAGRPSSPYGTSTTPRAAAARATGGAAGGGAAGAAGAAASPSTPTSGMVNPSAYPSMQRPGGATRQAELRRKAVIKQIASRRAKDMPETLMTCFTVFNDEYLIVVSNRRLLVVSTAAAKLDPTVAVPESLVLVNHNLSTIIDIFDDTEMSENAVQFTFIHESKDIKFGGFVTRDAMERAVTRARLRSFLSDCTIVQANYGAQNVWLDVTAELDAAMSECNPPRLSDVLEKKVSTYPGLGVSSLRPSRLIPAITPFTGRESRDWYNKMLGLSRDFMETKAKALVVTFTRAGRVYRRLFVDGQPIVLV